MSGGSGADVFVFGAGSHKDIITDFEVGVDTIALADGVEIDRIREGDNQFVIQLAETGTSRNDNIVVRGDDLTLEDLQASIISGFDVNEFVA